MAMYLDGDVAQLVEHRTPPTQVRSFLPDRSLGEGPDEACIPVLQTRGFGSGLTTWNYNKDTVTETAAKTPTTTVCDGLPESPETCINGSSESRKEATDRMMEVLSAKTKTRIGFWIVRTMYETGRLAQVTAEM